MSAMSEQINHDRMVSRRKTYRVKRAAFEAKKVWINEPKLTLRYGK